MIKEPRCFLSINQTKFVDSNRIEIRLVLNLKLKMRLFLIMAIFKQAESILFSCFFLF